MTPANPTVLAAHDLVLTRSSKVRRFRLSVPDLELRRGRALAVVGPNGAGKTTLLLALAGLLEPRSGRVDGDPRAATMVFQRPVPFAGSVAGNVKIALLGKGLDRREVEERVRTELDRFGLGEVRHQSAKSLSGGELRRLALARAMVLSPAALLLDEAFDDLDAAAQERLSADLVRLVEETRVALAVVTHDLRRASGLAHEMAVLAGGRLEQLGEIGDVLAHPASVEVARLVGMSNLLPGVAAAQRQDGTLAVNVGAGSVQTTTVCEEGASVWVGFRPERLKIDTGRGDSAPIGDARVVALHADSMLTLVTLDWAGVELRTHLLSGRGPSRGLSKGDVVQLSLQPADVHLMPRPSA